MDARGVASAFAPAFPPSIEELVEKGSLVGGRSGRGRLVTSTRSNTRSAQSEQGLADAVPRNAWAPRASCNASPGGSGPRCQYPGWPPAMRRPARCAPGRGSSLGSPASRASAAADSLQGGPAGRFRTARSNRTSTFTPPDPREDQVADDKRSHFRLCPTDLHDSCVPLECQRSKRESRENKTMLREVWACTRSRAL